MVRAVSLSIIYGSLLKLPNLLEAIGIICFFLQLLKASRWEAKLLEPEKQRSRRDASFQRKNMIYCVSDREEMHCKLYTK